MASVRGILNIQSLNELTYEKRLHDTSHVSRETITHNSMSSTGSNYEV
jgi:hypothetical protein